MLLAHSLAQTAARDGGGILCTLILVGAVIATILCLLALLGVGPWTRAGGRAYGGLDAGPLVAAVVLWVIYFIVC